MSHGPASIVDQLRPLFLPSAVAVIGASNDFGKWGYSTFASIRRGYPGQLHAVNHRVTQVQGHVAYPSIRDVPGPVDLAVIVIPAEAVTAAMTECVEKGVKAAVIISAGFAETGAAGRKRQDELMAVARSGGVRVVGPNCMGMWSAAASLPAFMFPLPIMAGPLALVSQGGNVGGALVVDAVTRGIGYRYYVSCGGMADIPMEDYVEYLGEDDAVKVIMLYIEGLADGGRFVEKVSRVTPKKPVVAIKPGRTDAAARAISSHSGSLSGSDRVYDAAFRRAGVVRVDSTQELLDVAISLISQPLPKGRRVAITTPGGSYGVICADACASRGLEVVPLAPDLIDEFSTMFPPRWSHGNPVDPAGDRNLIPYLMAPELLLRRPEIDALIFMGFGSFSGVSALIASAGEELTNRLREMGALSAERRQMARALAEMLDSKEPSRVASAIKIGVTLAFGAANPGDQGRLGPIVEAVADVFIRRGETDNSLTQGLKQLFSSVADGGLDGATLARVLDMLSPILDALILHWIEKYQKPVITTTFTEETSRIGLFGGFPFPSAERAAAVLKKLVERAELLKRDTAASLE